MTAAAGLDATERSSPGPQPGHLTPATASGWSLWRQIECRTAGFPAAWIRGFSHPESAAAADRLHDAQDELARAWARTLNELRARVGSLRSQLGATARESAAGARIGAQLVPLQTALRKAYKTHSPESIAGYVSPGNLGALNVAVSSLRDVEAAYEDSFARASDQTRLYAKHLAGEKSFREAIAWQNPAAVRNCLDRLLTVSSGPEAKLRSAQSLIAAYAQRYCTKNDTIGFFGPEGWASFADEPRFVAFQPGPGLIASREVFFEDWALRAYAAHLSKDVRLRPWQVPRRLAHLRSEGLSIYLPGGELIRLAKEQAAVFAACDGRSRAADIAARLCSNPFLDFIEDADVYSVLESLTSQRRIDWSFEVRVGDAWPERHLRRQLQRVSEEKLRAEVLDGLDALENARAALVACHGDDRRLSAALLHLNETFERVAGSSSTRNPGRTYGARTVVYQDCRRDMQLQLGSNLRDRLQQPLDLLLTSCRWYCHELSIAVRTAFESAFYRCKAADGRPAFQKSVPLATFWPAVQEMLCGPRCTAADSLQQELASRWETLLRLSADDGCRSNFSAAGLRSGVASAFPAPDCGWMGACYQSPDVMICARDAAAAAAGDCRFVLGELHMGTNTLMTQSALNQHPAPQNLLRAMSADMAGPRLIPLFSREGSAQPIRVQGVTQPGVDIEICFAHDAHPLDADNALSSGALFVDLVDGRLRVHSQDRRHEFDVLEVFGELLSALAVSRFRIFSSRAHTPRVSIDNLVIQRERWEVPCAELDFASQRMESAKFSSTQRWRESLGLPDHVFVKVPWEAKPFYLDFTAPILVRQFLRQVRGAREGGWAPGTAIVLTEMLPDFEDMWLTDARGNRFTSEFRIVAIHEQDLRRYVRA